jgi:hypothetical protein
MLRAWRGLVDAFKGVLNGFVRAISIEPPWALLYCVMALAFVFVVVFGGKR